MLKKRNFIFIWLRKKIGLNSLALELYKLRTQLNEIKKMIEPE